MTDQAFEQILFGAAHSIVNSLTPYPGAQRAALLRSVVRLMLAAIAVPLLVCCLLQGVGAYALPRNDFAAVKVFESSADQADFLTVPPNARNSTDSWWTRMLGRSKSRS